MAGRDNVISWNPGTKKVSSMRISGSSRDLFLDSHDRLWLGSISGLIELDESLNVINKYSLPVQFGDSRDFIQAIAEDKDGNIWFGSVNAGACRYDGKSFTNFSER